MDDDEIYGKIWVSELDLSIYNSKEPAVPKPPPRNESLKPYNYETDFPNSLEDFPTKFNCDVVSRSCQGFEGESVENLDVDFDETTTTSIDKEILNIDSNSLNIGPSKIDTKVPFPKMPCFSEFSDSYSLEYFGPIMQIIPKIRATRKDRYGVLLTDLFILFKKPEHKVSKLQIPIDRITDIYWYSNINYSTKNECNKFKIDTALQSYKFQCSNHENAGLWINHIAKLLIKRGNIVVKEPPKFILKASVTIENVKGKRVFTIEPQYTLAYYECEEDFCNNVAMHRVQLKSSGVRRDPGNSCSLELITSYRKYKLFFESADTCNEWCQALSSIIHKAISATSVSAAASVKSGEVVMAAIMGNESNRRCADCNKQEPEWASINLFVTLCSSCSGLHRGLGRHISSVQGILTDESTWQDESIIKLFLDIGNRNANGFFLALIDISAQGDIDRRFVYDKYVRKSFIGRKEEIFEGYGDQGALNRELFSVVKTGDVMRTMKLYHLGADINYVDKESGWSMFRAAEESGQRLQLTFLNNQSKHVQRDWRDELCNINVDKGLQNCDVPYQERLLLCSINGDKRELRKLLIWSNFIQITDIYKSDEVCKVYFKNICLVREKQTSPNEPMYLSVVVRETEFSKSKEFDYLNIIDFLELFSYNIDHCNDVRDFKNVIASKMCPSFRPTTSFDCIGWVIVSTPNDEWRPYLSVLNCNRIVDFHYPTINNKNKDGSYNDMKLDLRKVQKVEESRDQSYGSSCPYRVYNLASINLISSVIYHVRSDTKYGHEQHLEAFRQSWSRRDLGLSNQFLTKDNVPLAVHKMIQFLQLHGTQTEGPFRRVGSVKEAEKIYNELINDPGSFMLKDCTAYDVASALKLFFRKLDDPLLTKKLFKEWIAAVDIKGEEEQLRFFKEVVDKLPPVNYQTLRLLIFLLVEIVTNNSVTQMDPSNLSTSFNTCLLISGSQDPAFSRRNLQVLPFLLNNYKYLFNVSEEEIRKEEIIRKGLDQLCNSDKAPVVESTLLRQIYIDSDLAKYLKSDINFDREQNSDKAEHELLSKQMNITQSMSCELLKLRIFNETDEEKYNVTFLFEDRNIEDVHVHRLIYPQENVFLTITYLETFDSKSSRKWIFKALLSSSVKVHLSAKSRHTFKCWVFMSLTNKNKVFIEITETGQLNFWKSDQSVELVGNFPLKSMLLYRSVDNIRKLIIFKDGKSTNNTNTLSSSFPKFIQNFAPKPKSYHYMNFIEQVDYENFLQFYDKFKIENLSPNKQRPSLSVFV